MRIGLRHLLLSLPLLLLGGCGFSDTFSEWFEDERKVLVTRPLSSADYEDRIRGGVIGMLVGAGYASQYDHDPSKQPLDYDIRQWRATLIDDAIVAESVLMNTVYLQAMQREGIGLQSDDVVEYISKAGFPVSDMNESVQANLRSGILPPESGRPRFNPYADHYDLAGSASVFGLLSPGLPQTAGRLTRAYAEAAAYGEGGYAAMFVASTYATAIMSDDLTTAVQAGLASIPQRSQTADVVRFVLSTAQNSPEDWAACWQGIQSRTVASAPKPYRFTGPWLAGVVSMALLYGEEDFYTTLQVATQGSLGLEAPTSVACGILGAHVGYNRIPLSFSQAVVTRADQPFGTTPYTYTAFSNGIFDLGREVIRRRGGSGTELGEREYIRIPEEPPVEPRIPFRQYTTDMAQSVSPGWAQLPALRHESLQKRINAELAEWTPGWTIENCGDEIYTGRIERYAGRLGVLAVIPKSESEPCLLRWQGTVPANQPKLVLIAGAANESGADVMLSVTANQTVLLQQELRSTATGTDWQELALDLSAFAGQETRLTVSIIPTGWDNEAAYIGRVRIEAEEAPAPSEEPIMEN